jgi:hypothetical protein
VPPRINLEPAGASWASRERPKGRQERPKSRQERPKSRQERPKSRQEPLKSRQEHPKSRRERPRKAARRGPGGPLESTWRAKGRRGAPGTPQNTQNPSWKQQNTVIYSVLWLQKHCFFEPRKA